MNNDMDEDLELKMLRLRMMRKLMAAQADRKEEKRGLELDFEHALQLLREHLTERGDEVLEAALQQYPGPTRKIALILAQRIREGRLREKIPGPALLRLFESLGLRVKLQTQILYYKRGEYKSLRELLK